MNETLLKIIIKNKAFENLNSYLCIVLVILKCYTTILMNLS